MGNQKCWRKTCPVCRRIHTMTKRQITCSVECRNIYVNRKMSKAAKKNRARAATAAAAKKRLENANAKFQRIVDKLGPLKACKYAYFMGYNAGRHSRRYYELTDIKLRSLANTVVPGEGREAGEQVLGNERLERAS